MTQKNDEKEKRAAELVIANEELAFQNNEKEKRAAELVIANAELVFQNNEKEKRAAELVIANEELAFQNNEKEKRAAELVIANEELAFQNNEKEKRAAELVIANEELAFQNNEKEKRAAELVIANEELVFQNNEKEKRAAELVIANEELVFQNNEKEKRAAELVIANEVLAFQNNEKEKRAAELVIANEELVFQNNEKEKRAAELVIANEVLAFQNNEKEKRAAELVIANEVLAFESKKKALFEHQLQLQRSQRLESLGVLSGGIAHDFNNILGIIIGNCELIKMNVETATRNIPKIAAAAERGAGLCRQMMVYAGNTPLTITNVDMVVQVDEAICMLKEVISPNAVIKTKVSSEISMVKGDISQLYQVIMNLIINASEAIGTEQGKVDVLLSMYRVIEGETVKDYHDQLIPTGEYLCLEVTDNGGGMDEETKEKVFEPFYTTKFTGRGLGMSAVLGIIKSHAGALQLFSQLGQGTTFKIYLPALSNEHNESDKESSSVHSVSWKGSGTLLLVEDDENIRPLAKEFLEILGYTILEAVNGKEALKMYKNNATEINLVFTDMGMPVMDGYELFEKLKKIKPELPIVVSSGFGDTEISTKLGRDRVAGIVSKPYSIDKLREVMKGLLL
ncbi:response regulator [Colwellia sp. BRX8-9]|uniref:response regulator n=1 Tax=Colwellia sp. BRX8-9 TaxID=2759831 RepID=UPI0015F6A603|nr:response regulator [Colwellia sp. BRX8-9]MBA6349825.1 response regulator [Colwellia sp. BRX8-9]